jgi:hypothetical protein
MVHTGTSEVRSIDSWTPTRTAEVLLDQLGQELAEFANMMRDGLEALDFAGRQRLVRLLVERMVAADALSSVGDAGAGASRASRRFLRGQGEQNNRAGSAQATGLPPAVRGAPRGDRI